MFAGKIYSNHFLDKSCIIYLAYGQLYLSQY